MLAIDQLTKLLVVRAFEVGDSVAVLGPVMSLTRRTNTGGAFGIFPGSTAVFIAVSVAVVAFLMVIGPRIAGGSRIVLVGFGLTVGGAVGNLLDRIRFGHVVDFLDFHFWPVFNVADIGVTVGTALIVIALVLDSRQPPSDKTATDEQDAPSQEG